MSTKFIRTSVQNLAVSNKFSIFYLPWYQRWVLFMIKRTGYCYLKTTQHPTRLSVIRSRSTMDDCNHLRAVIAHGRQFILSRDTAMLPAFLCKLIIKVKFTFYASSLFCEQNNLDVKVIYRYCLKMKIRFKKDNIFC